MTKDSHFPSQFSFFFLLFFESLRLRIYEWRFVMGMVKYRVAIFLIPGHGHGVVGVDVVGQGVVEGSHSRVGP